MDKKLELLLRAICAYENEGEANFSLKCLGFFGHENTIRRNIQKIEEIIENGNPIILKTNLNGLYSRYKINKVLECPAFIYEEKFELTYKCILLGLYNNSNQLPEVATPTNISKISGVTYNTVKKYWSDSILEDLAEYSMPIKLSISENLESSKLGLRYIGQRKNKFYCKICGTTDPNLFYSYNHCTCKKCIYERRKLRENNDMAKKLYENSSKSFRTRTNISEYNLTKEYIQDLLDSQDYRCYYTRTKLATGSKLTNPTIDRIDSSKGYVTGNIVICTEIANIMKNDLSIEEFKNQINLLHNNINNL